MKTNNSYGNISPGAVRAFQRFVGLRPTGRVDELTWQKMREPRCGNKDLRRIQRRKRYILQGRSLRCVPMRSAFRRWQEAVGLRTNR